MPACMSVARVRVRVRVWVRVRVSARLHECGRHRVAARGPVVAVRVARAHDEHRVLAREGLVRVRVRVSVEVMP